MPTIETVYRKKSLLGMSDAELIEAGKAVLGSQAHLSRVCGASEKALSKANAQGAALPDVVRPLIVRAILRTQRGVAVPELPHVRGRPVSSDVLGSNVSLNLSDGELADFERFSAENPDGQKAVLSGAV